jgi:DNA ligase (NAD+)
VVKDLSFLVTNNPESGSAKNKKARDLGVAIIDEKQFLDLLKNSGSVSPGVEKTGQGELF